MELKELLCKYHKPVLIITKQNVSDNKKDRFFTKNVIYFTKESLYTRDLDKKFYYFCEHITCFYFLIMIIYYCK